MKYSRRFQYFQPNKLDLKDKVGDCQIRALCKALNLTWTEAFDLTIPLCRELQTYTIFDCDLKKTKQAMASLGFEYTGISNKRGAVRPTVDSFAKDHPEGTYIVSVAHHVVAVKDGCYFDTWDSGYKSLYGYYTLVGEAPDATEDRWWKVGLEEDGRWHYEDMQTNEMIRIASNHARAGKKLTVKPIKKFKIE